MKTQRKGMRAEQLAKNWLEAQGLTFVEKNFNARVGEIDLIMSDGDMLVFVEVRYRSSGAYGGGVGSVNFRKQRKLLRTAALYLQLRALNDVPARIDILGVSGSLYAPEYQWIRNAIEA